MATPAEGLSFKGVRGGAVFELLSDSSAALTYDTGFEVTMQEFSMNPDIQTAELPGNDVTLDIFAKARGITGTIKNAKVHSSFLAILLGAQVGTSSSTRHIKFDGDDTPKYFKFLVKVGYTGSGSSSTAIFTLYKCKLTSMEFSGNQDDYWTVSFEYTAIPTEWEDATGKQQIFEATIYDSDQALLS